MQAFLQAVRDYANDNQKISNRARFIVEHLTDSEILEAISDAVSEQDAIECAMEEAECCMEYHNGKWLDEEF